MGTLGGAGATGLSPNIDLVFAGTDDGSIPAKKDLDQPAAESLLKSQMQESEGWNSAHEAGYSDLTFGVPFVTNILLQVVDQVWDLTPLGFLPFHPSDLLDFIAFIPILGSIIPGLDASKITSGNFPQEMITGLVDVIGELTDNFTTLISDVVNRTVSGIGGIFDLIGALVGFGNNADQAQASADVANTGVVAINAQLAAIVAPPGGVYLSDNFDRTGSGPGSNWAAIYLAGSGVFETDGNNLIWNVSGGAARTGYAIHNDALATDTQMVSFVQTAPRNASNTDPDIRLVLRSDALAANFILAIIKHNLVEVGYVLSGVYTRLGAQVALTSANGDRWAFVAGTSAATDPAGVGDNRQFLLYRNDSVVCDRIDTGDFSLMGAAQRRVGLGMLAGVNFVPFLGFQQYAPPKIQGWAAADRAA